jgi:hypothetical protein
MTSSQYSKPSAITAIIYYLQSFLDTDREHIQRFPKETRLSVTHKNQITTLIIRNIRNRKLGKNATHSIIQDIENILCDNPKIVHIPTQNTTTQVTNALRDESNLIRLPNGLISGFWVTN